MADLTAVAELQAGGKGIAGAPVALLVVDDDCRVEEANLSACRLLGLGRDEVQDRQLRELFAPSGAERLEGIWNAFREVGGHAGPFELSGGDSGSVDINITAAVLPGLHLVLLSPTREAGPVQAPEPAPVPAGGPVETVEVAPVRVPTTRERQILGMLASGDTDTQIAGKLALSPATVQTHVRNAKAKLGARTRAQAVAMAIRRGLITSE